MGTGVRQVTALFALRAKSMAVSPALHAAETAALVCRHFAKRTDNFLSLLALLAPKEKSSAQGRSLSHAVEKGTYGCRSSQR
jgi:hypothetical protein